MIREKRNYYEPYTSPRQTVFKVVYDRYIEDTITEEQVMRVLEPIKKMILEGKFDRRRFLRMERFL